MSPTVTARRLWFDLCLAFAGLATAWHVLAAWPGAQSGGPDEGPLAPVIDVGVQVPIGNLWTANSFERTAILMLDTDCPACLANRSLYRDLGRVVAETPRARFVVLTEYPVRAARQWLEDGGAGGADIVRVRSRKTLGFLGTPTLLLADARGVVTDVAFGALGEERAERFKSRLRGDKDVEPLRLPFAISEVSATERPDVGAWPGTQLIDTRDRQAFAREHSQLAVNIPEDELAVRSQAELNKALPVFVDCRYDDQGRCRALAFVLGDVGFASIVVVLP